MIASIYKFCMKNLNPKERKSSRTRLLRPSTRQRSNLPGENKKHFKNRRMATLARPYQQILLPEKIPNACHKIRLKRKESKIP